jgi:uncharacterized membrane protein
MKGIDGVAKEDPELGSRASDRLTTFSDAVVAIAITLLAIDLPVPGLKPGQAASLHSYWSAIMGDSGQYLAFLISFLAIAGAWGQHHDLYRYVRGTDGRMRTFHLVWLLMIILIPFATKLLFSGSDNILAVHALHWGFYALLQVVESVVLLAMVRHLDACDFLAPGTPPRVVSSVVGQSWALIFGFGLSIPLFFVTPNAWVLWIVGPLLVGRARRIHRRRESRREEPRAGSPEKPAADRPDHDG